MDSSGTLIPVQCPQNRDFSDNEEKDCANSSENSLPPVDKGICPENVVVWYNY